MDKRSSDANLWLIEERRDGRVEFGLRDGVYPRVIRVRGEGWVRR